MTEEDRKQLLKYLGVRLSYGIEDKELLLKDLCARLPYGVIGSIHKVNGDDYNISIVGGDIDLFSHQFISIKPYLRPMSSMTDEEKIDYQAYFNYDGVEYPEEYIDWLNRKMFDYRGLIEKGLALEAPNDMYNI